MYRIFGWNIDAAPPTSEQQIDFIHPDDRENVLLNLQNAAERNGDFDMEHRIIRPDGTIRILHSQGQLIKKSFGRTR